jgi:hypothetical protein
VVEGALEGGLRAARPSASASAAPPAPSSRLGSRLGLGRLGLGLRLGRFVRWLGFCFGLPCLAFVLLKVAVFRGFDARLRSLLGSGRLAVEALVALELIELLHRDVELVGYPGIGPSLAHPQADLVELWAQGWASQDIRRDR